MVKISVDSGPFDFETTRAKSIASTPGKPLKILVLGGFCGDRADRDESLSKRKQYRVDKDNFDDVFTAMNVKLKLPFSSEPVNFTEYDDLHPDHLFENISVFERYKVLLNRLGKPSQFEAVVEELHSQGIINENELAISSGSASEVNTIEGFSLDALLSAPNARVNEDEIQSFIRQTVAPYVEPKEHPKVQEYSLAIELAINHLMRQIMHAGAFQQLEASWRSVDLLNRRVDTDTLCKLHIMDVMPDEILADLDPAKGELRNSELYKGIVESNSVAGSQAYDVILLDFPLNSEDDLTLLERVSALGEQGDALVFAGADYGAFSKITESHESQGGWEMFRRSSDAASVYVTTPSVMLRLPYGAKTSPIDSFDFEELPEFRKHDFYLWGNSAYLLLISMIQTLTESREKAAIIERLPIHVYSHDGESLVQPSGEQYLSDSEVSEVESKGGVAVQSVLGTDQVLIANWCSVYQS